ncbi:hypothetical protein AB4865_04355 [Capnocytophaga sp. ARDL2]|uniref:hypothetical protein n=1 Tax=Capnocytophaga sp. ARDL2 TaxID=3238809 RepID=UPI0035578676
MKKFTLLTISNKDWNTASLAKRNSMIYIVQEQAIETAIEKIQNHSINCIVIDTTYSKDEIAKITKLAHLLDETIKITTANFDDISALETLIVDLWRSYFKNKTFGFELEDAPNLNNPFLNLDKMNVFKTSNQ